MEQIIFNAKPISFGKIIEKPDQTTISDTPILWRVDLDTVHKFGNDYLRKIINECEFGNQHKYITVETRVHALKKGQYPCSPEWHVDDTPLPSTRLILPEGYHHFFVRKSNIVRPYKFHLFVTGDFCLPEYLNEKIEVSLNEESDPDFYKNLDEKIRQYVNNKNGLKRHFFHGQRWNSYDWLRLHKASPSKEDKWRLFVRITESDYLQPITDLAIAIGKQSEIFTP